MPSLWSDRLAEVWAPPGHVGSGVVVGERGVLTARHVIEGALAGDGRPPRARVVRPGMEEAEWVPMAVVWEDAGWDVALLSVDLTSVEANQWLPPESAPVTIVALGGGAEPGCEATGFPRSEVVDDPGTARVRQSEQVVGTVLPAGQGKLPVRPERPLWAGRWVPLDVETATPGAQAGWGGISGAGVLLPDGRLIGLVVTAESGHDERRLYVVPLAAILKSSATFAAALEEQTLRSEIPQARSAPVWGKLVESGCLGGDGLPAPVSSLVDLGAFGVKEATIPDEPPFLDYVPRDADENLRDALERAIEKRRMLFVVGESAAGKSRSAAEAVRRRLPDHRFLRPRPGRLTEIPAALPDATPAVAWLDDVQFHAHDAFADTLKQLLDADVVVVATIRKAVMDHLDAPGDIRNATGDALTDETLIERISWPTRWSTGERERVAEHVRAEAVLSAVSSGTPLGAYCVAGPKLVQRFHNAEQDRADNPAPYALVRTVLDWCRTDTTRPIPIDEATRLAATRPELDDDLLPDELEAALKWATTPEFGPSRRTRPPALLSEDTQARTLMPHDYVLDRDQRTPTNDIPDDVWACAIAHATDNDRAAIGSAAYEAERFEVAMDALMPLAVRHNVGAMFQVGFLLDREEPGAGRSWYELAAEAGHGGAMHNLGLALSERDPVAARGWAERAAEAGYTGAMAHLGLLLHEQQEPEAARRWYERAAAEGDANAMALLGVLLEEQEPETARGWYERAAEAGESVAMLGLGRLLEPHDPVAALGWFERAAEAGDFDAMLDLGRILEAQDPAAAHGWYERAAEAGKTTAMYKLATLLEAQDPLAARDWFERAAEAGHPAAMLHIWPRVRERDPEVARRSFERAASGGDAEAMFKLGALLEEQEPATSRDWYKRAAEAGNADAMLKVGQLLAKDDPVAARDWFERGAAIGDAEAMFHLGELLAERDPAAALAWWERAAEAQHAGAMFRVALQLEERDAAAARDWYERAAQAGEPAAMFNLAAMLVERDPAAGRDWWERAAEAGVTDAMFNLGLLLAEEEPLISRGWYERAAEAGHVDAMDKLGHLLVHEDLKAAGIWWERAAEAGNTAAMANLGLLLVERNPAAARRWWERAAEAGVSAAMFNLGVLLGKSDPAAARSWYERAAEGGDADAAIQLQRLSPESD